MVYEAVVFPAPLQPAITYKFGINWLFLKDNHFIQFTVIYPS